MKISRAKVIFIEVSNDNQEFLSTQYKNMAHSCPDYAGVNKVEAVRLYIIYYT